MLLRFPSVAAVSRPEICRPPPPLLRLPPSLPRVFWVRFAELLLRSAAAAADYWKNVICSRRRRRRWRRDPPPAVCPRRGGGGDGGDDEAQYRVSPHSSFSLCESGGRRTDGRHMQERHSVRPSARVCPSAGASVFSFPRSSSAGNVT